MFLSHHEKSLDAKRRVLIPQDFRDSAVADSFDGVYCFSGLGLDCLECGGAAFFDRYHQIIQALPPQSAQRRALEARVYGEMRKLNFDTAGRITLPEDLCQRFGLSGDVVLVGLYDRFQIWSPAAHSTHSQSQAALAEAFFSEGQGA